MQAGEFSRAEQGFDAVLAADPSNFAALGNLGVLYSHTHRFAKAIDTDQRALKIDPKDPSILLNLGLAYMKQEQYARARPYFQTMSRSSRETREPSCCWPPAWCWAMTRKTESP